MLTPEPVIENLSPSWMEEASTGIVTDPTPSALRETDGDVSESLPPKVTAFGAAALVEVRVTTLPALAGDLMLMVTEDWSGRTETAAVLVASKPSRVSAPVTTSTSPWVIPDATSPLTSRLAEPLMTSGVPADVRPMPYRPAWLPDAVKVAEPDVKAPAAKEAAPRPGVVVSVPGVGPLVLDRPIDSPVSS